MQKQQRYQEQFRLFAEQLYVAKKASEFRIDHSLLPLKPSVTLRQQNTQEDEKYLTVFTFSGCNYNLLNRRKIRGENSIIIGSENTSIEVVQIPRRTEEPRSDIQVIQAQRYPSYSVWNIDQLSEDLIVFTAEDITRSINIWNLGTNEIENRIDTGGHKVLCYGRKNLFTFGGRFVACGCGYSLQVYDVLHPNGKLMTSIQNDGNVRVVEPLFNGTIATGSDDHRLRIYDLDTNNLIQTLNHSQYVWAITCLDKTRLVSADQYQIHIWNYIDGTIIKQWDDNAGWIRRVMYLGSDVLAVAGDVGSLKLWNIADSNHSYGLLLRKFDKEHGADVLTIEMLGDGRMVTSGRDGTIRIWNITDKEWGDDADQCFPRLRTCQGFYDVDILR